MSKRVFTKAILVTAMGFGASYSLTTSAAGAGNLINSDSGRFQVSINAENSKRDIKQSGSYDWFKISGTSPGPGASIYTETYTESFNDMEGEEEQDHLYLKLSYAVTPSIEVYGKLGAAKSKVKFSQKYTATETFTEKLTEAGQTLATNTESSSTTEYFSSSEFSGRSSSGLLAGIGAKAVIYDWGSAGWKLIVDAQYQYKKMGDSPFALSETGDDIISKELQGSLMFAKNTGAFRPYFGVSYIDLEMEYDAFQFYDNNIGDPEIITTTAEFENANNVGAFAGFQYSINPSFGVGGEIRAGAEQALNFNLYYNF